MSGLYIDVDVLISLIDCMRQQANDNTEVNVYNEVEDLIYDIKWREIN